MICLYPDMLTKGMVRRLDSQWLKHIAAKQWELIMADSNIPHFHNDAGVAIIRIGAKEFQCIGAKPPFDHPHVFLDMGDEAEIVCPYCSTLYKHDQTLADGQSEPADAYYALSA